MQLLERSASAQVGVAAGGRAAGLLPAVRGDRPHVHPGERLHDGPDFRGALAGVDRTRLALSEVGSL